MTSLDERNLLEVHDLRTYFYTRRGTIKSVDGVDLKIKTRETVGLAGETGAGKSQTAFSIMRLVQSPGKIVSGKIVFKGRNLLEMKENELRQIRGKEIGMIFQDPVSYLNPYLSVGKQIVEAILAHENCGKTVARARAVEILGQLGIGSPSKVVDYFPHQLSGGMAQRVMMGIALSCSPSLLIADEPTSALDVTVQRQILQLMGDLKKSQGISLLLITHDLGILAEMCDRIYVMYGGRVVESGDVFRLFEHPMHPYTQGLIQSTMSVSRFKEELTTISGMMPDPSEFPTGCRFHPRCSKAKEICRQESPSIVTVGNSDQEVSCWLYS